MLPGILNQLGAESLTHLKKFASNVTGGGTGAMEPGLEDDDDDEVIVTLCFILLQSSRRTNALQCTRTSILYINVRELGIVIIRYKIVSVRN